jgi:hypothetical protein
LRSTTGNQQDEGWNCRADCTKPGSTVVNLQRLADNHRSPSHRAHDKNNAGDALKDLTARGHYILID